MNHRPIRSGARWIGGLEPWIVILAAPLLLFPTFEPAWTLAALAALLCVWLCRWIGTGRPGARTSLDGPLLLLAAMIPVAVLASPLPGSALPKLAGLILGFAAFRAVVNASDTRRGRSMALALFMMLGLGMALVGLVSTPWADKWPALKPFLARIPRLVQGLPGAESGINSNELGGTLTLFLPVSLVAILAQGGDRTWAACALRLAGLAASLFLGIVLVLTQSRSAWLGLALGLGVMAWIRWRWARWAMMGLIVALAFGLWILGPESVLQALFQTVDLAGAGPIVSSVSLDARIELWNRALATIQNVPFTGCGLGAFRYVVHVPDPLFITAPGSDIAHAHNVLLQAALDLGLPGLYAYLALVGTALWMSWRVARPAERRDCVSGQRRWLALGLVGSLVAFHVFGLTDTIALGAKPGLALWIVLGLAAALWAREQGAALHETAAADLPSHRSA